MACRMIRGQYQSPAENGGALSRTCIAKLKVMNSQTGLRPAKAAPTAIPQNPASVIAVVSERRSAAESPEFELASRNVRVSTTRFSPNLSRRPLVTCGML